VIVDTSTTGSTSIENHDKWKIQCPKEEKKTLLPVQVLVLVVTTTRTEKFAHVSIPLHRESRANFCRSIFDICIYIRLPI
jgi:hypothetical protein